MLFTIAFCILFFLYCYAGIWYSIGMSIYIRYNNTIPNKNNNYSTQEDCWKCMWFEIDEFIEAVKLKQPVDIILEGGDVAHSFIKWLILKFFPDYLAGNFWVWFIVFPFVLPATLKLGRRYYYNNCIRNHKNKIHNIDHSCIHSNFTNPKND